MVPSLEACSRQRAFGKKLLNTSLYRCFLLHYHARRARVASRRVWDEVCVRAERRGDNEEEE